MATFRMGAKLRLTIEVNGFRVECNGEVKVVYPNLGMGIAFTTMSDSDRERLRELLRSLSRPSVILAVRPEVTAATVPEGRPLCHEPGNHDHESGCRFAGGHELL